MLAAVPVATAVPVVNGNDEVVLGCSTMNVRLRLQSALAASTS